MAGGDTLGSFAIDRGACGSFEAWTALGGSYSGHEWAGREGSGLEGWRAGGGGGRREKKLLET